MEFGEEKQPIIIVKKSGGHGGHHGGAWKVAYADFVTALMAFFLVMWLVNQSQVIKDNVQGYFNDPSGFKKKSGQSILQGGSSILKAPAPPKPQPEQPQGTRKQLEETGEKIMSALRGMPNFETLKDHVEIEMTPEGLRIQLIESAEKDQDSSYFFDIGSAKLSRYGIDILDAISIELGKLSNRIVIEGHTDSKQYAYQDKYSNWELSADRANSARKLMETKGLKEGQVAELRGYAANLPKYTDDPTDQRNRRIALLVLEKFP